MVHLREGMLSVPGWAAVARCPSSRPDDRAGPEADGSGRSRRRLASSGRDDAGGAPTDDAQPIGSDPPEFLRYDAVVVRLAERLRSGRPCGEDPAPSKRERADGTSGVRAPGAWTGPSRTPRGDRCGRLRRGTAADDPSDRTDRPAGAARHAAASAQPGTGSHGGAHRGPGAVRRRPDLSRWPSWAATGAGLLVGSAVTMTVMT